MQTTHESLPTFSYPLRIQKFISHSSGERIHWHDQIEILYFTAGEGHISCNLREYPVKKGTVAVINSKELHTGHIRGTDAVYYCIHVHTDFFHNLIGNEYALFHNIIENDTCTDLLQRIVDEAQKNDFKSLIAVKKMMYEFFLFMGEFYTNAVFSHEDYKKRCKQQNTFNSVIEYIDLHYDEDLNAGMLAEHFFMSQSYFAHLFKKRTNKGVTEYINEARIHRAKELLEREDLSIGAIACRVGFNDINYFSRKFKAITGMTPTQYKRTYESAPMHRLGSI